jgi:NDP-sugar pyrophosphorylase family protein
MRDGGITGATVCVNSASRAVRSYLGDGSRLSLSVKYLEDWTPRGAAGCLRDASAQSQAETFVVADGTAIPAVNLKGLLAAHRASGAALTIVVHDDAAFVAPDQRLLSPAGIYVVDSRVLQLVAATSYQDIKESLIPQLYRAGERIGIHRGVGACPRILDAESYLAVNHWMIQSMADGSAALAGYRALGGGVLAHPSAEVDSGAVLLGPILLGPSARVERGATIVGPVALGAHSLVEAGALVSRTVTWSHSVIGREAVVDQCVVADQAVILPRSNVVHSIQAPQRPRSLGAWARAALPADESALWPAFPRWAEPPAVAPEPPQPIPAVPAAADASQLDSLKVVIHGVYPGGKIDAARERAIFLAEWSARHPSLRSRFQ